MPIPNSVTKIGSEAFSGCESLTSVTIPEGVTEIRDNTFSDCTGLTSIAIPAGVTRIGDCAFWGCARLGSVTLPEAVTEIGDWAFQDCTGLDSIVIPRNVGKIGKTVFENCRPALIAPHISINDFAPVDKLGAVRGFAKLYLEKAEMDEDIRAGYLKHIRGQKKLLYPHAVQYGELLQLMFEERMIPRQDIDLLLNECDRQNNAAARAAVLEYAH